MSETFRLLWKDLADNQTNFKIYRSSSGTFGGEEVLIAILEWNGSTWNFSSVNGLSLDYGLYDSSEAPSSVNVVWGAQVIDSVVGTWYYGISSGNEAGDSDIVPTSTSITVT